MFRAKADGVTRVACVGSGTIGAGWAAYFLARGLDVVAYDPGAEAQARLRSNVADAWPALERLGLSRGASRDRLSFNADLAAAVADVDFIQESAPDDEDLKIDLLAKIGAHCPADIVIASSSSKFVPSRLCRDLPHPERLVIGHPFVPSYLIPLVEVVGGPDTAPEAMDWAEAFYTHIGKRTLRLKKEIEAYVANRLQHVLFNEAIRLVEAGVCEFEDIDTAVAQGPGLRWAFAGPALLRHLGGGKGGVRHMIDHFGWGASPESAHKLIDAVERDWGGWSVAELERWRDENLLLMLEGLKQTPGD